MPGIGSRPRSSDMPCRLASYGAAKREVMPRHRASPAQGAEQQSGKLAPADAPTRAADEAVQIGHQLALIVGRDHIVGYAAATRSRARFEGTSALEPGSGSGGSRVTDDVVAADYEGQLVADLNCFICRSRRRVGWCEFSALLFSPLCWRCSMPGHDLAFGRAIAGQPTRHVR